MILGRLGNMLKVCPFPSSESSIQVCRRTGQNWVLERKVMREAGNRAAENFPFGVLGGIAGLNVYWRSPSLVCLLDRLSFLHRALF